MLVTTPIWVGILMKVPSDSSASTTIHGPAPRRALEPQSLMMPPVMTVGSRPASTKMCEMSEVVVVLPCVPVTEIEEWSRISSASISARRMMGSPLARAASSSGLPGFTAVEMTT